MKHRKSGWVNGGEIVRLAMPNEVGEESTANETGANVVAVGLTVRGCAFRFRRMSLVCLACVLHVVGDRAGGRDGCKNDLWNEISRSSQQPHIRR